MSIKSCNVLLPLQDRNERANLLIPKICKLQDAHKQNKNNKIMQSLQVEKKDIKGERKIKETQRERERRERLSEYPR